MNLNVFRYLVEYLLHNDDDIANQCFKIIFTLQTERRKILSIKRTNSVLFLSILSAVH